MSVSLGLSIISLLLAFWALYWSRRHGKAAEDSAAAAKRSADAAESSSVAATRSAQAAEASANTAIESLNFSKQKALQEEKEARARKLDGLVQEAIDKWPERGELLYIVLREPTLTDDEIRQLVFRVGPAVGYPQDQMEQRCKTLIEDRKKRQPGA